MHVDHKREFISPEGGHTKKFLHQSAQIHVHQILIDPNSSKVSDVNQKSFANLVHEKYRTMNLFEISDFIELNPVSVDKHPNRFLNLSSLKCTLRNRFRMRIQRSPKPVVTTGYKRFPDQSRFARQRECKMYMKVENYTFLYVIEH